MTYLILLICLVAVMPALHGTAIVGGLLVSRSRRLALMIGLVSVNFFRFVTATVVRLVPARHASLKAVSTTLRDTFKWRPNQLQKFLSDYRRLETLSIVRKGMKRMGIGSLYEVYWRRDLICKYHPDLMSPYQRPIFFIPGVRSQAFYKDDLYPWIEKAMALVPVMRQEFLAAQDETSELKPYYNEFGMASHPFAKSSPEDLRPYKEHDWNMLFFYRGGKKISDSHLLCPATSRFINSIPELQTTMVCFSALKPGVWIPPHYGLSNAIVRIHIPIIVPDGCTIRVGEETRHWQSDRPLVFDDSFEHEVYNRSSETRVVLFLNAIHPEFSASERQKLEAFLTETFTEIPAVAAWGEGQVVGKGAV